MLVFRVEKINNPDDVIGVGAWRARLADVHDACISYPNRAEDMPMPSQEPAGNPVHNWVMRGGYDQMRFGFESIRSYHEAFKSPEGRAAMHNAGGSLSVYEVPREAVLVGAAQVIFDYCKAKRVAVLKCTDDYYAT